MTRVSRPRACKTKAAETREKPKKDKLGRTCKTARCTREDVMKMFQDPDLSEEEEESSEPQPEYSCRLCNERKKERKMQEVPKQDVYFNNWGRSAETFMKVEGQPPKFFENCRNNPAPHFICSDHVGPLLFGIMQLPRTEAVQNKKRGKKL